MGKLQVRAKKGRSLRSPLAHEGGAVFVFVAILLPVLIGLGAFVLDLGRLMTVHTELQSAADSASIAGARELDQSTGAIQRARAAAQQAVTNIQTFATDPNAVEISTADCADLDGDASCMRFLWGLPDDDNITPIPDSFVTTEDAEARFIEVRVGAHTVSNFLIRALAGQSDATSTTKASAVAGNTQVFCAVPPIWMCNPTEPLGNSDPELPPDLTILAGRQVKAIFQGGGGGYTPGNFGLLCPLGTEDDANCGGAAVKDALASTEGTCIDASKLTTKTGVTLGPIRAGLNVRMDYWLPQAQDPGGGPPWRFQDRYVPAVNVTQGGKPQGSPLGNSTKCEYNPLDQDRARGQPRDACHVDDNDALVCPMAEGRIGDGVWDYAEYFRINHKGTGLPIWQPPDWPFGASWPPTRFQVYRYEAEQNSIVQPGQPITNLVPPDTTTLEDGKTQCFQGTPPVNTYDFFSDMAFDIDLLFDRRVFPIAIANCNAIGNPGGKFTFDPAGFYYIFMTEPMANPSESALFLEFLGPLDEGSLEFIAREVVQIYRR